MSHVITVDEADNVTGTLEKMEAHRRNVRHRAFSVFCVNSRDQLLLQKRAYTKYHSPGLWTNTCCSHPQNTEFDESEVHERLVFEMGFDAPLDYMGTQSYQADLGSGLFENEIDRIYRAFYEGDPVPNSEEVAAVRWVSLNALGDMLSNNPHEYTVWFRLLIPFFIKMNRNR